MKKDKSNIILLNEGLYEYECPPIPADEKEIINFDKPKKEQLWITPKLPDLKKMTERDRIETINKWRNYWLNGCYVFINGEAVYLTGLHWEHLSLNTYNSNKLLYFDDERYIFYFIDHTEKADECEGRCWIKPRRAKMTTIMCSLAQRKVLQDFSNYITIQSDTLDKAMKSYMYPIIDSYTRRPAFMREKFYAPNGKKPRKSLELTSNMLQDEGDDWLGGKINIFPTLPKAIDGLEAIESIIDEFSKFEDVSPYELYEIARKVVQNFRKKGKIDCLSSTGDSKDAAKATMDWHKLIANSNPHNKDKFGKTVSGLWEYFISAIHSQYVPKEFTDIYGKVNKEKAEEWVWNEIKKYPVNTKEYIFALYKLPLKKEHALLSSAITNLFNKPRISERLLYLDGLLPEQKPYIRGILEEDNLGKVWFKSDVERQLEQDKENLKSGKEITVDAGNWLWAVQPYFSVEKNIDTRNRFTFMNNVFFPPINPEGCISYDPINFTKGQTKSSNISQACLFIRKKHDYFNSGVANVVMAICLYRPDDPHDANREAMKACKFTGYPCMHERSAAHVHEDFRDNNMLPFLMKASDGLYGMLANTKNTNEGIVMLQTRYRTPKNSEEVDEISIYPFEDGLRSLDNFDPSNTHQFDPTMAEIYCEHGLKQMPYTNATNKSTHELLAFMNEINPVRNK